MVVAASTVAVARVEAAAAAMVVVTAVMMVAQRVAAREMAMARAAKEVSEVVAALEEIE